MAQRPEAHDWAHPYEHHGATYRECALEGCGCYQEWICALDRWSDPFSATPPRRRDERLMQSASEADPTEKR